MRAILIVLIATVTLGLAGAAEEWHPDGTAVLSMDRPEPRDSDIQWSRYLAYALKGQPGVRLLDGTRVDVLTEEVAWETGWLQNGKWQLAVTQAILHRVSTGKRGGVLLLVGKNSGEDIQTIMYLRCLAVCRDVDLELQLVDVRRGGTP